MTLILVVPANDGLVIGSDTQLTYGMIRATGHKIRRLNSRCLWAAAGELALIQRVEERIGTLPDEPLVALRNKIGPLVRDAVNELLQSDFRSNFCGNNPNQLLDLHPGDFVFVEADAGPCVLHVMLNGTSEWVPDGHQACGNGEPFAYALLHKYRGTSLNLKQAAVLVYKIIDEAIQVGAYGLGAPVDIWQLSNGGVKQLDKAERAALEDVVRTVREGEIALLTGDNEA